MADPTDAQVLQRVQQGDYRAYTLLFDRYYAAVERYAMCLLGNAEAAASAASATFEQGFRAARRSGSHSSPYPAHLFALCRRLARRAGSRRAPWNLSLCPQPNAEDFGDSYLDELPLSIILSGERDALVRAALNELAIEDREIIHLAFEPALRRRDIGIILKQPRDEVVTAHLFRALRRLGAAIHQAGYARRTPAGAPFNYVQRPTRT